MHALDRLAVGDASTARPRRPLRVGFTLVELLVVVAVISLLAAILFPVFAGAREKARQAVCLSNMRQVTLAVLLYAQDNDDGCPIYGAGVAAFWPQFVAPYVQPQAGPTLDGASRVFVCPSAPDDPAAVRQFGHSSCPSYGLTDDWMQQVCPDDCQQPGPGPIALSQAVAPANTILLAETMYRTDRGLPGYGLALPPIDAGNSGFVYADCDAAGSAPFSPARMLVDLSWRHSGPKAAWCADPPSWARINVAYADGHVRSATAAQLRDFRPWSVMQGRGTSGCYPDTAGDGGQGCWYP
jgi:prepilin-type N-terminal cleavage/methylation domain-containing protein/prepilin-type processing-associated H-X9-DG protein